MKRTTIALLVLAVATGTGSALAQGIPPRVVGLSGLWAMPSGDFGDVAGDGWGILLMGEQYVNPTRLVSVTSDLGYVDFGAKTTAGNAKTDFSMFPVAFGLRVYPMAPKKPNSKAQLFGQGGLGFTTVRSEVQSGVFSESTYDYFFLLNAGAGLKIAANPKVSLLLDATWNWIFGDAVDPNYLALRGGLVFPFGR